MEFNIKELFAGDYVRINGKYYKINVRTIHTPTKETYQKPTITKLGYVEMEKLLDSQSD